jgi:membrane fusion protein, multidrug efflux system
MRTGSLTFKRKIFIVAISASILVTVFINNNSQAAKTNLTESPSFTKVTIAPVLEKSVIEWNEYSGRIEAIENVKIRTRVGGAIDLIHFKDGQIVKKGDLLFTIDPRPYQAELAKEEAYKSSAVSALELARTDLDRTRRLTEEHAVAQRELDEKNNAYLNAAANLKSAEAMVLAARLNLQYTAIKSPVSGRVSRAEITTGNLVSAGENSPILTTVVSVSPVYVNFEIDEQAYSAYAAIGAIGNSNVENIPVEIGLVSEVDYPHKGYLKSFDNRLDTSSGTIRARAVLENKDGILTPGMFARVHTSDGGKKPTLLIDDKAIGTDQDKKFVMVVDGNNKATYRSVILGPMVDGLRVIRSGLKKDEKIIINGLQKIKVNDQVEPVFEESIDHALQIQSTSKKVI